MKNHVPTPSSALTKPNTTIGFESRSQAEAFECVTNSLAQNEFLVVLNGESGAGKSHVLRRLARSLAPRVGVVLFPFASLTLDQLLQYASSELGVNTKDGSDPLMYELSKLLGARQEAGERVVFLVDEAQNLPPSTLRGLREIAKADEREVPLLSVVLATSNLDAAGLESIDSDTHTIFRIGGLHDDEFEAFVQHELARIRGARDLDWAPDTLEEIRRLSTGIPRSIVTLCERAVQFAQASGRSRIDAATIAFVSSNDWELESADTSFYDAIVEHETAAGEIEPRAARPDSIRGDHSSSESQGKTRADESLERAPSPVWYVKGQGKGMAIAGLTGVLALAVVLYPMFMDQTLEHREIDHANPPEAVAATIGTAVPERLADATTRAPIEELTRELASIQTRLARQEQTNTHLIALLARVEAKLDRANEVIEAQRQQIASTRLSTLQNTAQEHIEAEIDEARREREDSGRGQIANRSNANPDTPADLRPRTSQDEADGVTGEKPEPVADAQPAESLSKDIEAALQDGRPSNAEPETPGDVAFASERPFREKAHQPVPIAQSVSPAPPAVVELTTELQASSFRDSENLSDSGPLLREPTGNRRGSSVRPEQALVAMQIARPATADAVVTNPESSMIDDLAMNLVANRQTATAESQLVLTSRNTRANTATIAEAALEGPAPQLTAVDVPVVGSPEATPTDSENRPDPPTAVPLVEPANNVGTASSGPISARPAEPDSAAPPVNASGEDASADDPPRLAATDSVLVSIGADARVADTSNPVVDGLLDRARSHVASNRLTRPPGNNAVEAYREILTLEPDNRDALEGLSKIKAKFVKWANAAQRNGQPKRALKYYRTANAMEPQDALVEKRLAQAEAAVSKSVRPAQRVGESDTPLILAVKNQDHAKLQQLLSQKVAVNEPNAKGDRALMFAVWNDDAIAVKKLLAAGADPTIRNKSGWTPIMYAAVRGHEASMAVLLATTNKVEDRNSEGKTALSAAAWNGHTTVVSQLLKSRANPNVADRHGWTVLMYAAANGHTPIVKLLLDAGAKIDRQSRDGSTALMKAAWNGHHRMVETLLRGGANPNLRDHSGATALAGAELRGRKEVVEILKAG